MGTGKFAGRCGITSASALGPPVDVPMATMSTRMSWFGAGVASSGAWDDAVAVATAAGVALADLRLDESCGEGRCPLPFQQSALIFGMTSRRTRNMLSCTLPTFAGFAT